MGGWGSGNRWRWGTKDTCGEYTRIEMPFMRKKGYLTPGYRGSLSWNRNGEPSGAINFQSLESGLRLNYRARKGDEDWETIDEFVPFQWTDQKFGGQRQWLTCLSCRCRCAVLYGGKYYRCRKCWNLAYQSQNEDKSDRLYRRSSVIHKRLGGSGDRNDWLPEKPKGMHWKTYSKLAEEYLAIEDQINVELGNFLNRIRAM